MLQHSDAQQTVPSSSDLHVTLAPPKALAEVSRWPSPNAPLRLPSLDEASDCTSSSDFLFPSQSFLRNRRRKAGLRALRFIKQHSFSQHALFCLLSGRSLVVVGDASSVRKLVEALSLFLPAPGPRGNAVMPSLTTPLQLADLLTWRLMGIHRSDVAPAIFEVLQCIFQKILANFLLNVAVDPFKKKNITGISL